MIEPQVLVDKLNGLGTVDAVRKFLIEQGVKGEVVSPDFCVVAEYVRRESGRDDVRVIRSVEVGNHHYPLGFHVREFITRFDCGHYLELEKQ